MKDLLAIVRTIAQRQPPSSKKWWLLVAVSPLDAAPDLFTSDTTKHQLMFQIDPFVTRVSLTIDGELEYLDPKAAAKVKLRSLLERLEKKYKVRYRLDLARMSGSPPALKGAVRDFFRALRTDG